MVGGIGLMVGSMTVFWIGVALAPSRWSSSASWTKMGYGTTALSHGRARHRARGRAAADARPGVRRPTRCDRLRGPLLTGGLVAGLTLALHFRDPHASGSWGFCPWLALTGHYCPGCGGLRAVNDLTNGDVVGAPAATCSSW